ncbi:unnamed protein product [Didymodactylos carnosus]|uniref:Retrotransposon gag domain-containing protein n=1 Tax=Didymodactylos carnosus TaxID=1234261 RepID=A0A814UI21_9BILA|nr:unnamed protein product [Didymodactylos carnosus]CAF3939744.1 unnamed protein product [Didymodactylos carnosus]
MIDQIIVNLLRKTLETQTPKFSGSKEENVTDWVKTVKVEFKLANCPDHEKLDRIPIFLCGEASTWYFENIAKIHSSETITEELEKKYSLVEKQHPSDSAEVTRIHSYLFHQHYQVHYDQHTSIPSTITPTLLEYGELEWPEQGETWTDYEIKEQRERFQKTPINECDILSGGK